MCVAQVVRDADFLLAEPSELGMTVYTVWIVNKSGGLAYQRTIHEGFHPKLSSNDYLVLASTFQR